MTKFIQLCASQNDLFALDAEGNAYQYHFNVKTWVMLTANRKPAETSSERSADDQKWAEYERRRRPMAIVPGEQDADGGIADQAPNSRY